jgi:hypothetical protein
MAQELLDKIAKGENPTAEEIGKYKNICKALNAGIEAWKQDIIKAITAPVPASCRWYVFIGFFSLIKTTNGRLHFT